MEHELLHPLRIGSVTLPNNIILAPMAGVTDLPFRLLCQAQGAGMTCTEMISAKAIFYQNKNTEELMEIHPQENYVSLQLFGSDPALISDMAKRIEERPFCVLDINMGCPVPKVVNNQEGAALMKDSVLAGKIIEETVKAVRKPVTVKIRKGFDDLHINAAEIAHVAQESGATAVTLHARTREQYYSGRADWEEIGRIKDKLTIPVIGNGDVWDEKSAERMLRETGCDGVMIGRGARGNPWIFSRILHYLETGEEKEKPSVKEVREMVLHHAEMLIGYKGEYTGVREMRKHVSWYTAGYPHSASIRRKVNEAETMEELKEVMDILWQ